MGATTLNSDGETTVGLTMMMHRGMEGPHLFHVTVPVRSAQGETSDLHLYVRADFR